MALLVGHWTCYSQVTGSNPWPRSSPGWAPLHSGLGQATYLALPLSASSIIWYRPRGSSAGKVTAQLAESNNSLFTAGFTTKSPAGWVPRDRDQLRDQRSLIKYMTTLHYLVTVYVFIYRQFRYRYIDIRYIDPSLFIQSPRFFLNQKKCYKIYAH